MSEHQPTTPQQCNERAPVSEPAQTFARQYNEYGRRCRTCRGQLFQHAIGTGELAGRTIQIAEVFCEAGCEFNFHLTAREQALMARVKNIRYYAPDIHSKGGRRNE